METVVSRFLRYISYDTQSDELSETCPSTDKQRALGMTLAKEMQKIGISGVHIDDDGYVYGFVPGNPDKPTIGLISHMDTSPDASGANVHPKIVEFHGEDICLNSQKNIWLRRSVYPSLMRHVGKHLIVTDGTTLLGADDKAGIAEILTAVETVLKSGTDHAPVSIAFTPDEEIGRGPDHFDMERFTADYAYTVDGGPLGEIEYENFNAAAAKVAVHGLNIHPGSAKGQMVNSMLVAMEFQAMLPVQQRPEFTEGYEGFFHLNGMEGTVEETALHYIIRDHDAEKFEAKKGLMKNIAGFLNEKYGSGTVEVTLRDSYYNMKSCIAPCMYIVEQAKYAMQTVGIIPQEVPIRGGTDGATLSHKGLPCPNLFTGGENYHGRFEYIPVEDMDLCVRMLVHILEDAPSKVHLDP